jgi:ABC-type Fe3+ transport system substrate-binding protein
MELVPTNAGGIAVVKTAPHPYTALLLTDFILSPHGQRIFVQTDVSSTKDNVLNRFYPERGLTALQYDDQMTYWLKLLRDDARK